MRSTYQTRANVEEAEFTLHLRYSRRGERERERHLSFGSSGELCGMETEGPWRERERQRHKPREMGWEDEEEKEEVMVACAAFPWDIGRRSQTSTLKAGEQEKALSLCVR